MKKTSLITLVLLLPVFALISLSLVGADTSYQTNNSNYTIAQGYGPTQSPQLIVQSLSYDPYPVQAGQWFNIWIRVQNVGTNNAPSAQFQLISNYPFDSIDSPVRNFGVIAGSSDAYKYQQLLGDSQPEVNQVIMEFRVHVANNAPSGSSVVKLAMTSDNSSSNTVYYDIPISIANTGTDFAVVSQGSTTQGTSFAIANTGENPATAVIVSIPQQRGIIVSGSSSSVVGNLNSGDYTSVSFQVASGNSTIPIDVSYTDTTGVRQNIQYNVSLGLTGAGIGNFSQFAGRNGTYGRATASSSSSPSFLLVIVYLVLGALIYSGVILFVGKKKKGAKNEAK